MNETETNIKHGYSLMVRDARGATYLEFRGANFKSRAAGAEFMPRHQGRNIEVRSGVQYWSTQGAGRAGFLNYVSPGGGPGGTCQVMYSGRFLLINVFFDVDSNHSISAV